MKKILWGILLTFAIFTLTYGSAFADSANNFLKGGISGSCGNTGVGLFGIAALLAVLAARRIR